MKEYERKRKNRTEERESQKRGGRESRERVS